MNNSLEDLFYKYGKKVMNDTSDSLLIGMRRFKSSFGISPAMCSKVWNLIKNDLTPDFHETHLLWALFFLKTYNTESVNRSIFKCDEKTFRKRVWCIVESLAFIKVV